MGKGVSQKPAGGQRCRDLDIHESESSSQRSHQILVLLWLPCLGGAGTLPSRPLPLWRGTVVYVDQCFLFQMVNSQEPIRPNSQSVGGRCIMLLSEHWKRNEIRVFINLMHNLQWVTTFLCISVPSLKLAKIPSSFNMLQKGSVWGKQTHVQLQRCWGLTCREATSDRCPIHPACSGFAGQHDNGKQHNLSTGSPR